MPQALKILIASAEAAPIAKVGGLGDAVFGLAKALAGLGHRVKVALPAYGNILKSANSLKQKAGGVPVEMGRAAMSVDFLETRLVKGIPAWLVRHDPLFDRQGIYADQFGVFNDNPLRFILFSKSIPALAKAFDFEPDVIIANDWHTGLVCARLNLGDLPKTASIFVIHNIGYTGIVLPENIEALGVPESFLTSDLMEFYGSPSLLKAGIAFCDTLVTVSPTHAREIQTPEYGAGLDGLVRHHQSKLSGILNGVDFSLWNPADDKLIAATYKPGKMAGKAICKKALVAQTGLAQAAQKAPLAGMVTRLVSQKGIDILLEGMESIMARGLYLVVLGSGLANYEDALKGLAARFAGQLAFVKGYNEALARRIIAGADIFLMPSLYEPCGLTQMYALKYGTLPVARRTGGLADTIRDTAGIAGPDTGFLFDHYSAHALAGAVDRAVETFGKPDAWNLMRDAAMTGADEFAWERAALSYQKVIEQVRAAQ
jgi:starch synthase